MSFTQEQETNSILHCDGCKKHCKLDVYYGQLDEITNNFLNYYTPIIGNKKIIRYKDATGTLVTAYKSIADLNTANDSQIRQHMLNLTQEITHLCDHYKTR